MRLGHGWLHLVGRFVCAMWPLPPRRRDSRWAASVLLPGELELWRRLVRHDRRHAVRVARRLERHLAETPHAGDTRWIAAALLHDVGKLEAGLGVLSRVAATLLTRAVGARAVAGWRIRPGWRAKVGVYLAHGEIGAAMIRTVGGREEVARWAASHHQPEAAAPQAFPEEVARALAASDPE